MLIDSLPTKVASSFQVGHARPPKPPVPVAPARPARSEYDALASTGIGTPRDQRRRLPDKAGGETHGKPQLVRKPSDWTVGSRASLVRHGPTKTIFEILACPDLRPDDALALQDFRARLVHGGAAAPAAADLEMLRGEAVLMALFLIGLAWPVTVNPVAGALR
jgi:hypothetical protein